MSEIDPDILMAQISDVTNAIESLAQILEKIHAKLEDIEFKIGNVVTEIIDLSGRIS